LIFQDPSLLGAFGARFTIAYSTVQINFQVLSHSVHSEIIALSSWSVEKPDDEVCLIRRSFVLLDRALAERIRCILEGIHVRVGCDWRISWNPVD
jgi:hypothetical protein